MLTVHEHTQRERERERERDLLLRLGDAIESWHHTVCARCWGMEEYYIGLNVEGVWNTQPFRVLWSLFVTQALILTNSTFCPHSVVMCFVWISKQTAIISLYNIN